MHVAARSRTITLIAAVTVARTRGAPVCGPATAPLFSHPLLTPSARLHTLSRPLFAQAPSAGDANNNNSDNNTITAQGAGNGRTGRLYSKSGMDGFTDRHYNAAAEAFIERVERRVEEAFLAEEEEEKGEKEAAYAVEECSGVEGVLTLELTRRDGATPSLTVQTQVPASAGGDAASPAPVAVVEETLLYVINKQAPKLQLWLSSPVSGAHHYDMVVVEGGGTGGEADGEAAETIEWRSDVDQHSLADRLQTELGQLLGKAITL